MVAMMAAQRAGYMATIWNGWCENTFCILVLQAPVFGRISESFRNLIFKLRSNFVRTVFFETVDLIFL